MIYLDAQASTPCDPRVVSAMMPYFTEFFGNPHSEEHRVGLAAREAVERARGQVAAAIGASPTEIIFTSGATEANNLAIKGAARFARAGGRRRIITFATEHKCVLESVRDLADGGFEPVILPVGRDGRHDPEQLRKALLVPTLLVSAMAVNNETGILHDLAGITAAAKAAGALMHSDFAQGLGRVALEVAGVPLDLVSLSAHKIYGPKGVGALYVRRRPRVRLTPLFSGGGQERGLRPGTLPAPLIVGFGEAARLAVAEMVAEQARIAGLRNLLWAELQRAIPGIAQNAPDSPRIAGNLSLLLPRLKALDLIAACPELAVSTGSACSSAEIEPSQVLSAMGISPEEAGRSLRVGIGRFTSSAEITRGAEMMGAAFARLTTI